MIARTIKLSLLLTALVGLSATAFATPIPTGSLTPISFDDGGTVTGSFTLDATGATLTGWNFTTSGGTSGVPGFTYNMTDSTATFSLITPGATASGPPVAALNIFAPGVASQPRHNLEFTFYDPGLTLGTSLGLCDIAGGPCLTDGPLSIVVQSGEQYLNGSNAILRDVVQGSFDITDPPGGFAFNSDSSQTGSVIPPTKCSRTLGIRADGPVLRRARYRAAQARIKTTNQPEITRRPQQCGRFVSRRPPRTRLRTSARCTESPY